MWKLRARIRNLGILIAYYRNKQTVAFFSFVPAIKLTFA